MSEGSSGEKTEQPTQKRLNDARKKGQVSKSADVVTTIATVSVLGTLSAMLPSMTKSFEKLFYNTFEVIAEPGLGGAMAMLSNTGATMLSIVMPIALASVVGVLAGNVLQIGVLFAFESLKPDLKKISPMAGIKKVFSLKNLLEFIKSLIKITVLCILLYNIIKGSIEPLMDIPRAGFYAILAVFQPIFVGFIVPFMGVYTAVSLADFLLQKRIFLKDMKMTKDEVKREYKESEGNPEIKGQRKQLAREAAQEDPIGATKKSTVLITNPTHYAAGIYYEAGVTRLPVLSVKGSGNLALKMIDAAHDAGVPVIQNIALAQNLYANVDVDAIIPTELLAPVAEILKWVQGLPKRRT